MLHSFNWRAESAVKRQSTINQCIASKNRLRFYDLCRMGLWTLHSSLQSEELHTLHSDIKTAILVDAVDSYVDVLYNAMIGDCLLALLLTSKRRRFQRLPSFDFQNTRVFALTRFSFPVRLLVSLLLPGRSPVSQPVCLWMCVVMMQHAVKQRGKNTHRQRQREGARAVDWTLRRRFDWCSVIRSCDGGPLRWRTAHFKCAVLH